MGKNPNTISGTATEQQEKGGSLFPIAIDSKREKIQDHYVIGGLAKDPIHAASKFGIFFLGESEVLQKSNVFNFTTRAIFGTVCIDDPQEPEKGVGNMAQGFENSIAESKQQLVDLISHCIRRTPVVIEYYRFENNEQLVRWLLEPVKENK